MGFKNKKKIQMLLLIMVFLIVVSIYISAVTPATGATANGTDSGVYGALSSAKVNDKAKSKLALILPFKIKPATLGLYASFIVLFWVIIEVTLSMRSQNLAEDALTLSTLNNNILNISQNIIADSTPYLSMNSLGVLEKEGYAFFNTAYISIDTLSAPFCLLTGIIFPIAILASEEKIHTIAPLLITEAILLGAFVTLDLITFYAMFEAVLIPMFIIIGRLGSEKGEYRKSAAYRLFLYTGGGSLIMLLGLIYLYNSKGSGFWYATISMQNFISNTSIISTASANTDECSMFLGLTMKEEMFIFITMFFAFAIKVPMVPFHLWLPEAHTIAPTPISMILAAIVLKLGGFGMLRWVIPVVPNAVLYCSPLICVIATVATMYASFTCLRQTDIKRVIAYSSIVHMNICIFAIFTLQGLACKGAIFEMVSHGLISAGLFFCIGVLYNRYHTRTIKYYKGLTYFMPIFSVMMGLLILSNSGVPLFCGFIGELYILSGSFGAFPFLTIIISISTIINAAYNIWLFNRIAFGHISPFLKKFADLTFKETLLLSVLSFYILVLGIFPNFLLKFSYLI